MPHKSTAPGFKGTWFPDKFAKRKKEWEGTLDELAELIRNERASSKARLPFFKLALFGDLRTDARCLRHDDNVLRVSGFEGDHDTGAMTFDAAVAWLKQHELEGLVYTTASFTPEKQKWRIELPFSEELDPPRRRAIGRAVNAAMGGHLAPESLTLSQAFYYGCLVGKDANHKVVVHHGGKFADLVFPGASDGASSDKAAENFERVGREQARKTVEGRLSEMEFGSDDGPIHNTQLSCSASMLEAGHSVDETVEFIIDKTRDAARKAGVEDRWNWSKEEQNVRRMCDSWLRKHPLPALSLDDFFFHSPSNKCLFLPTGELWPPESVNAQVKVPEVTASRWLARHRSIMQMTWAPGLPQLIEDKLIHEGGWFHRRGARVFNLYKPPTIIRRAGPVALWRDHLHAIYPDEAQHIEGWFGHRVQRPDDKINHAITMGGKPGVGKDSINEPLKRAVGPWNWQDVSPKELLGTYNPFAKSVIMRINEARDLGEVNQYAFIEHLKSYAAAPPDALYVNMKYHGQFYVPNVCGVIITTNHDDALALTADDRRHFVAWSDIDAGQFNEEYWTRYWHWLDKEGGAACVAQHLAELDLSKFNAKAPPRKTKGFFRMLNASRPSEVGPMLDAIEGLKQPDALTIEQVMSAANSEFGYWLKDVRNRKKVNFRLKDCGYVAFHNPDSDQGLWSVGVGADRRRTNIYVREKLTLAERFAAVDALMKPVKTPAAQGKVVPLKTGGRKNMPQHEAKP